MQKGFIPLLFATAPPPPARHAIVQTYETKVNLVGSISEATLDIHDDLIQGMDSAGLLTGLEFLWTQSGNDFASSKVAVVHPNSDHLVTTTGFVAGDWSEATGYNPGQPNLTKYADANWTPHLDEYTIAWYSHTNLAEEYGEWGVYDNKSPFRSTSYYPKYTDNLFYGYNNNKDPNSLVSGAIDSSGFWAASWGATSGFASRGSTVVASSTYVPSSKAGANCRTSMGFWANKYISNSDVISWQGRTSHRMSFFVGWGRALSEAEAAAMSTLVTSFNTAMGR